MSERKTLVRKAAWIPRFFDNQTRRTSKTRGTFESDPNDASLPRQARPCENQSPQ